MTFQGTSGSCSLRCEKPKTEKRNIAWFGEHSPGARTNGTCTAMQCRAVYCKGGRERDLKSKRRGACPPMGQQSRCNVVSKLSGRANERHGASLHLFLGTAGLCLLLLRLATMSFFSFLSFSHFAPHEPYDGSRSLRLQPNLSRPHSGGGREHCYFLVVGSCLAFFANIVYMYTSRSVSSFPFGVQADRQASYLVYNRAADLYDRATIEATLDDGQPGNTT